MRLRSFAFAVWIALALAVGQQAVHLHDLGHAIERLDGSHEPGLPAQSSCDTHFVCAQLGSAVGASVPALAFVATADVLVAASVFIEASQRACLAFRSRAPPA